jgi:hypothetical protein
MIQVEDWGWKVRFEEGKAWWYRPNHTGSWTLASSCSMHDYLQAHDELSESIAKTYLRWLRTWANFEMELFAHSHGQYQVTGIRN